MSPERGVPDSMKTFQLTLFPPDRETEESVDLDWVMREIADVTEDMQREGVLVFARALHDPRKAVVVRPGGGIFGEVPGPYQTGQLHQGGETIIRACDVAEAIEWARRCADATGLPVEVREFQGD